MKVSCVLLGAPGCGKGTQAVFISRMLNVPVVSTSDLIRKALSSDLEEHKVLREKMEQGELLDDTLIWGLLKTRLKQADCDNGCILDGFPRTMTQLEMMVDEKVKIDVMLFLDLPDSVIVERMSGRRVHASSGRSYHIVHNPPKVEGVDDITGEPLIQRSDDSESTVLKRLAIFSQDTMPMIRWAHDGHSMLGRMVYIDAAQSISDVQTAIRAVWQD